MESSEQEDVIGKLKGYGLQVTHQRLAIYQELFHSKEHLDAEMIYRQVKKRFPMISLGTVYKTLERFSDVGLIRKVSPVTEVARYEANTDPHHHLICVECQSIKDVDRQDLKEKIHLPDVDGYEVLHYQLLFHGYCPTCQKH
jgi:Fur family transcriptional regulator, peroxide stress response regulator